MMKNLFVILRPKASRMYALDSAGCGLPDLHLSRLHLIRVGVDFNLLSELNILARNVTVV